MGLKVTLTKTLGSFVEVDSAAAPKMATFPQFVGKRSSGKKTRFQTEVFFSLSINVRLLLVFSASTIFAHFFIYL